MQHLQKEVANNIVAINSLIEIPENISRPQSDAVFYHGVFPITTMEGLEELEEKLANQTNFNTCKLYQNCYAYFH